MTPIVLIRALAVASLLNTSPAHAQTQPYPNKSIRLIIPFAQGGVTGSVQR